MTGLMNYLTYREMRGTDGHSMSAIFATGATENEDDRGWKDVMGAETCELGRYASYGFAAGTLHPGIRCKQTCATRDPRSVLGPQV